MNYLFMAVQKEAERSKKFGSREEAWEYFKKRFGEEAAEKKRRVRPVAWSRELTCGISLSLIRFP